MVGPNILNTSFAIEVGADPADTRKTAVCANDAMRPSTRARLIRDFDEARTILRSSKVRQAGAGANVMDYSRPEELSLFYSDGEPHRKRRGAIAPYFTLRAIETRYTPVMERTADALIARLRTEGEGALDGIAFRYAVAVAAEVIGLDHSDLDGLTSRIEAMVSTDDKRPTKDFGGEAVGAFNARDIDPAIELRRETRREDVISRLLDAGVSQALIRTEVRGYSLAGMLTTREFIVMAAWYLLEQPALLQRYRLADKAEQLVILDEIIRLEPPVGVVKREIVENIDLPSRGRLVAGTVVTIDIRSANVDATVTGACPYALDPERSSSVPSGSGFMSFGDGPHRCPGAQLAMHEARVFLERLLALPEVRMVRKPDIAWFRPISTYELHEARIACTPG